MNRVIIGIFLSIFFILGVANVSALASSNSPELVMGYNIHIDQAKFGVSTNGIPATIVPMVNFSNGKTIHKLFLTADNGDETFVKVTEAEKVVEKWEDGFNQKWNKFHFSQIQYNGKKVKDFVEMDYSVKIKDFGMNHTTVVQIFKETSTDVVKIRLEYDTETDKTTVFELDNGVLKKTQTLSGYKALVISTLNGKLKTSILDN